MSEKTYEKILIAPRSINQTVLLIAGVTLCYFLRNIILASFIGIIVGVLIVPILNYSYRKLHVPRSLAAFVVILTILSIVGLVFFGFYFMASEQVQSLIHEGPRIINNFKHEMDGVASHYPWMKGQMTKFNFMGTLEKGLENVLQSFQFGVEAVIGVLFILALAVYSSVNSRQYFESAVEAFPARLRGRARRILCHCAVVLRGWISAQFIAMLILGAITALSLWIIGIQYWAVFGLLSVILGFVPYLGTMMVLTAVSFITLATQPDKIWWVLLSFFITHQLESQVIIPLVMRNRASLPEVPLLIFMLIMGSLSGILGFFIAPAAFAVLKVLYDDIYLPKMNGTSPE
ncbi:MAG: AI-2E family transporter [Bacteriovoracaceae bacterium]